MFKSFGGLHPTEIKNGGDHERDSTIQSGLSSSTGTVDERNRFTTGNQQYHPTTRFTSKNRYGDIRSPLHPSLIRGCEDEALQDA